MSDMQSPILITGCARSGTSLVAGIINMCGAFGGKMSGATPNNPKGMYENSKIRNNIVKPYLRDIGVDKMGQYPLPGVTDLSVPGDWRSRVEQVMRDQGYVDGSVFYKGAKICLTWPVWYYTFPDAKWVIVRRRTDDIVNSCLRTGFMRAFGKKDIQRQVRVDNEYDGWVWWVNQHLKRFQEMADAGLDYKVVWPHKMVYNDYREIMELINWLGLEWNSDVFNFIDPRLWHSRAKE